MKIDLCLSQSFIYFFISAAFLSPGISAEVAIEGRFLTNSQPHGPKKQMLEHIPLRISSESIEKDIHNIIRFQYPHYFKKHIRLIDDTILKDNHRNPEELKGYIFKNLSDILFGTGLAFLHHWHMEEVKDTSSIVDLNRLCKGYVEDGHFISKSNDNFDSIFLVIHSVRGFISFRPLVKITDFVDSVFFEPALYYYYLAKNNNQNLVNIHMRCSESVLERYFLGSHSMLPTKGIDDLRTIFCGPKA